jgi:hypothetical protein
MAQLVSCQTLTAEAWVCDQVSPCGVSGGQRVMEQVILRVLTFSPVNIIPPWLSIRMYHLGDNQSAHW